MYAHTKSIKAARSITTENYLSGWGKVNQGSLGTLLERELLKKRRLMSILKQPEDADLDCRFFRALFCTERKRANSPCRFSKNHILSTWHIPTFPSYLSISAELKAFMQTLNFIFRHKEI